MGRQTLIHLYSLSAPLPSPHRSIKKSENEWIPKTPKPCRLTKLVFFTQSNKKGVAPLARTSSMSSCVSSDHTPPQGYRTPIDEDDSDEDERRDEVDEDPPPLTPRAASLLQAPSPNSAVLTVSLEGYLEPRRISFGSPPMSELNPRGPSPDETFPVFSPPPYDPLPSSERSGARGIPHRRQSSFAGTTWISDNPTPRQSIVSFTSRSHRSHRSHHTCKTVLQNVMPSSSCPVHKLPSRDVMFLDIGV